MARRHWLDPFARQVLRISGHLPPPKSKIDVRRENLEKAIHLQIETIKKNNSRVAINSSLLIDVNRATASDWCQLPGCTNEMVELLIRLQRGGVQLSCAEDLYKLLDLPKSLADAWKPHLLFQWYGDAPPLEEVPLLDMNCASSEVLRQSLEWPTERLRRLLWERHQNPFRNLADLQERLSLPASAIENLIGKVRFGTRSAGPILPPGGLNS